MMAFSSTAMYAVIAWLVVQVADATFGGERRLVSGLAVAAPSWRRGAGTDPLHRSDPLHGDGEQAPAARRYGDTSTSIDADVEKP